MTQSTPFGEVPPAGHSGRAPNEPCSEERVAALRRRLDAVIERVHTAAAAAPPQTVDPLLKRNVFPRFVEGPRAADPATACPRCVGQFRPVESQSLLEKLMHALGARVLRCEVCDYRRLLWRS